MCRKKAAELRRRETERGVGGGEGKAESGRRKVDIVEDALRMKQGLTKELECVRAGEREG